MIYLFEHIINLSATNISIKLDEMELTPAEKEEVEELVKSTIHHQVMDFILSELTDENKEIVISVVAQVEETGEHSKYASLVTKLKDWIQDFESKVIAKVKEAEYELVNLLNDRE